jgi:glycine cleavage system H protein
MKYTSTHEWIDTSHSDEMTVGITDHAQSLLGDLVFIDLPPVGKQVKAGEELGVVESVKAASDFYAPISGTVTAINTEVQEHIGLVNESPEERGWLVKIKPDNINELELLLDEHAYQNQVTEGH